MITGLFHAKQLGLLLLPVISLLADVASAEADAPFHDDTSGLNFVSIPAGSFVMGTPDAALEIAIAEMPRPDAAMVADETPAHNIVFDHAFNLSTTEVTQQAWYQLMQTRPGPDSHWQHKHWQQLPVVSVSWQDAKTIH